MKKADKDQLWALLGGLLLGTIFGGLAVLGLFRTPETEQFRVAATEPEFHAPEEGGPILEDKDEIRLDSVSKEQPPDHPTEQGHAEFDRAVDFWQSLAVEYYGEAALDSNSPLTKEAARLLRLLEETGDPIAHDPVVTLLIYTEAAHRINHIPPRLDTTIKEITAETARWKAAAEQNSRAWIAAQKQILAEQERTARAQTAARTPIYAPSPPPTTYASQPSTEQDSAARATKSRDEQRSRYYDRPQPIPGDFEIRNGVFYTPNGFGNITRQGGSVLIEP